MTVADRPDMAAGYGIATHADGMVSWSWTTDHLTDARSYWVCTTYPDGRPHAMPVWGLWLNDSLLFSTDPESVKGRNLAARPDVVVHLESADDVAIASGRVQRLRPDELPDGFVTAYAAKYDVELDVSEPGFGFYRLKPERILAWREGDFPTSATRFTPSD